MYNISVNKITALRYPQILKNCITGVFQNGVIWTLCQQENKYVIHQINCGNHQETIYELDIDANEVVICDLYYLAIYKSLFVATNLKTFFIDLTNGNISKVCFPSDHIEDVIAASWNCEQDSIAVAYKSGRIKVFALDFVNFEFQLLSQDHPDHKGDENVYLGWGDVRKQFKGKGDAAHLKENQPPDSTYLNNEPSGMISWKYQERYFSVNSHNGQEHIIRTFDNECRLFYTITNMKIPGIGSKTFFGPKHNLLATICKGSQGESYVVLHEKNGGYYNKIIPFAKAEVMDIQFANCGRLLTMHSLDENRYFIDVYTRSNFAWHHKQRFEGPVNELISYKFQTLETDVYSLELLLNDRLVTYELMKSVTTSTNENKFKAYVQRANCVQEFDYKNAIIPPCGVIDTFLEIEHPINIMITNDKMDTLIVIDSQEVAHVFETKNTKALLKRTLNLKPAGQKILPVNFYKYLLTKDDGKESLIAIGINSKNENVQYCIDVDNDNDKILCKEKHLTTHVSYLCNDVTLNSEKMHVISNNRRIKSAYVFQIGDINICCTLDTIGKLYINDELLDYSITSMLNYKGIYLLLTMTVTDDPMDKIICIPTKHLKSNNINLENISWSRRIEKGAVLITLANNEGVILEMPRGNIELITVRPIILTNVHEKIIAGQYRDAYNIIRRNSMEVDVLFELHSGNISAFKNFINTFENAEIIKFLIALKDESVITINDRNFIDGFEELHKKKEWISESVYDICKEKTKKETSYYRLMCIALMVGNVYNTLGALKFLVEEFGGCYTPDSLIVLADVLNFLKTYADVNEMYKQALTLYDIELAGAIAQISGMDPQIYRKFLEMCSQQDEVSKRWLMANEGGNSKSASLYLLILHRQGKKTVQQFVDYVTENNCIEIVFNAMNQYDGDAFKLITGHLVKKYSETRSYEKAAEILYKAHNIKGAIELLIQGIHWKEAIEVIASHEEFSREDKLKWYGKVAQECIANGKYLEGAQIYVENCNNVEQALECYLTGCLFREFVKLVEQDDKSIDKSAYVARLLEVLKNNIQEITTKCNSLTQNFELHFKRLLVVRENRSRRSENQIDDDAYSEAGSVTTKSHTSASTTTRRIRKLEMKVRSLRHGGKFEDIALIRELHDTFTNAYQLLQDLTITNEITLRYEGEMYNALTEKVKVMVNDMEKAASEIWQPEFKEMNDEYLKADFCTENIVLLDKKYRSMPKMLLT